MSRENGENRDNLRWGEICNWDDDDSLFSIRIGYKIRFYRREAKISQKALAEIIGVSTVYISQAETGRLTPSLPVFVKICNALDRKPEELLSDSLYATASQRGTRFQNLMEEYDARYEDMAYNHLKHYLEDLESQYKRK